MSRPCCRAGWTRGRVCPWSGGIAAGTAPNAIPREGVLSGTVRALDASVWERAPQVVEQAVRAVVAPYGVGCEVTYTRGCRRWSTTRARPGCSPVQHSLWSGRTLSSRPSSPSAGRTLPGTWRRCRARWPGSVCGGPATPRSEICTRAVRCRRAVHRGGRAVAGSHGPARVALAFITDCPTGRDAQRRGAQWSSSEGIRSRGISAPVKGRHRKEKPLRSVMKVAAVAMAGALALAACGS